MQSFRMDYGVSQFNGWMQIGLYCVYERLQIASFGVVVTVGGFQPNNTENSFFDTFFSLTWGVEGH